jgi:hypothetical protein
MDHKTMNTIQNITNITTSFLEKRQQSQLVQTIQTQPRLQVYTVQVKKQVADIIENLSSKLFKYILIIALFMLVDGMLLILYFY